MGLLKAKQRIELNKTFVYVDDGEPRLRARLPPECITTNKNRPYPFPYRKACACKRDHRSMIIFRHQTPAMMQDTKIHLESARAIIYPLSCLCGLTSYSFRPPRDILPP